tara:strand:- start:212 stop:1924 length:1713 start_codon:yes stop_codon:yes gene_type:complete
MAEEIFIQLGLILFTAFVVSYIVKKFNQPLVIGYIIAGVIISPFIIGTGVSKEVIQTFSEFGIAFLLFMVGMHLNPKVIKEIGGASLFIGLIQIVLTSTLGFFVALLLGFDVVSSAFIGIALSFSSTIIIMKLLSDKKQIDSLYGKLSIGILIIEDLVAIGILMYISSLSFGGNFESFAIRGLLSGVGLIVVLFIAGFLIIPKITKSIASSQELLFLFSITWAFVIAALFSYLGFSIAIGALVAGVILSISPYSLEITSRIRPLRDFFLIIFFIILGFNIELSNIGSVLPYVFIFSLLALVFKPLSLMTLSAFFGYTKRTNFLVGTTLAQISEFSLIVLTLGVSLGYVTSEILSIITLTAIVTITISTYGIMYSNEFYQKVSPFISFLERKRIKKERKIRSKYSAILFGYNRIGFSILRSLKKIKKNYLVVDFNPDTVSKLSNLNVPSVYGDSYDTDLLDELALDKIKIAVSTIPDFETNVILIQTIREVNPKAIVVVRAHEIRHALELYALGANYVLTPHFLGGEYVAKMIGDFQTDEKDYEREKNKHLKMLGEITNPEKSLSRNKKVN